MKHLLSVGHLLQSYIRQPSKLNLLCDQARKAIEFYEVNFSVKKVLRPFFFSHLKRHEEKLELGLISRHAFAHLLSKFATLLDVLFTTPHHTRQNVLLIFTCSLLNTEFLGFFMADYFKDREKY
jgi:hypothetical protein